MKKVSQRFEKQVGKILIVLEANNFKKHRMFIGVGTGEKNGIEFDIDGKELDLLSGAVSEINIAVASDKDFTGQ